MPVLIRATNREEYVRWDTRRERSRWRRKGSEYLVPILPRLWLPLDIGASLNHHCSGAACRAAGQPALIGGMR